MHVRNLSDTKEPSDAISLLWVTAVQAVKEENMQMNKESNKPCIKWPDKETVQKTLLTAFKKITQRYIVL